MVRLNVEAVVDLTSRFLPTMVARGRGAIINLASLAAFQPLPGAATYAASKAFVLSFSEAIRTELRGSGVTVTAVCPGPVKTEFTEAAGMGGVEDETPDLIWHRPRRSRATLSRAPSATSGLSCQACSTARDPSWATTPRARLALPLIGRIWGSASSRGQIER